MRSPKILAATVLLAATLTVPATAAADTVTAGKKQSGKTITLDRGDTLKIKLTENPSTGYGWKVTTKPSSSVLGSAKSQFLSPKEKKDQNGNVLVGAPGTRVFSWKAKAAGTTRIVVKLFPPGSKKAASTLSYRVVAR